MVIGEDVLAAGREREGAASRGRPAGLGSPAEDPAHVPGVDGRAWSSTATGPGASGLPRPRSRSRRRYRASVGLRLAAKLEAVLHRLRVDLMTVADTWEADPLVLGRDTEWQVTLARGKDGAWRFDRETVSRVPDMFERLTPEEKSARERRSNFQSAQQAMRTLLHASNAGDLDLAARCLDLDGVPQGARGELGPILAYKLKFVLDRIGRVVLEEIPAEADGPRYYYYRGPLGRIDLVRRDEEPRRGDWQFSRETVARIETMFRDASDRPVAPTLAKVSDGPSARRGNPGPLALAPRPARPLAPEPGAGAGPLPVDRPGDRPGGRRGRVLAGAAGPRAGRLPCPAPGRIRRSIARLVASRLRPLAFQLGLWCLYHAAPAARPARARSSASRSRP